MDDLPDLVDLELPLSVEQARLVVRSLEAYVDTWEDHYLADAGRTHTPQEWEEVRDGAGRIIWRLEELAVLPGQRLSRSHRAIPPRRGGDDGGDGGAGVREPQDPRPAGPGAAAEQEP